MRHVKASHVAFAVCHQTV